MPKPTKILLIKPDDTDEFFEASFIKDLTGSPDSYVVVKVRKGTELYEELHKMVSVLNIAGVNTEVEEYGEQHEPGVYQLNLTESTFDQLTNFAATA